MFQLTINLNLQIFISYTILYRHLKEKVHLLISYDMAQNHSDFLFVSNVTVSMLKTDFYVCGLAPLGEDLVVLAFVTEGPKQEVSTAFFCQIEKKWYELHPTSTICMITLYVLCYVGFSLCVEMCK